MKITILKSLLLIALLISTFSLGVLLTYAQTLEHEFNGTQSLTTTTQTNILFSEIVDNGYSQPTFIEYLAPTGDTSTYTFTCTNGTGSNVDITPTEQEFESTHSSVDYHWFLFDLSTLSLDTCNTYRFTDPSPESQVQVTPTYTFPDNNVNYYGSPAWSNFPMRIYTGQPEPESEPSTPILFFDTNIASTTCDTTPTTTSCIHHYLSTTTAQTTIENTFDIGVTYALSVIAGLLTIMLLVQIAKPS